MDQYRLEKLELKGNDDLESIQGMAKSRARSLSKKKKRPKKIESDVKSGESFTKQDKFIKLVDLILKMQRQDLKGEEKNAFNELTEPYREKNKKYNCFKTTHSRENIQRLIVRVANLTES